MLRRMKGEPKPYHATPDELRAIDEGLAERPAELIAMVIRQAGEGDPASLAAMIIAGLRRAGYEIQPRPDLIPIRPNRIV